MAICRRHYPELLSWLKMTNQITFELSPFAPATAPDPSYSTMYLRPSHFALRPLAFRTHCLTAGYIHSFLVLIFVELSEAAYETLKDICVTNFCYPSPLLALALFD